MHRTLFLALLICVFPLASYAQDEDLESVELPPEMDEERRIAAALEMTGGNKTAAAKVLGISRVTLWKKLKNQEQA